MAVAVRAVGAIASGTGTITPALPAGLQNGDIMVLFCETKSGETVTVSGWTQAANSPQEDTTDSTRLTVFWKRALNESAGPTTNDPGDHIAGRIIAFSGCRDGDPWNATNGSTEATSDTSISIPGLTTTVDGCMVISAVTHGIDLGTATTAGFSAWANASLASITERIDNERINGDGGAIGVATGIDTTAGTVGATTATMARAGRKALWMGALEPARKVENLTDDFDDNSLDTTKWSNWGGAQNVESGGKTVITIPNATSDYYGMESVANWSLIASSSIIELSSVSDVTPDELEVEFQISSRDNNNRVWFLAGNSQLHAWKEVAGSATDITNATYNSTTMKWLRLRESGGTTYWEYSADRSSWTTLHSESNPIDLTDIYVNIDAGCWDTTHGQVIASFDNYNTAGVTNVTANATKVSTTSSVGTPTVTGKRNVSTTAVLVGVTSTVGTPTVTGRTVANVSVSRVSTTSSVGTPVITTTRSVTTNAVLVGVTSSVNAVSVTTTRSHTEDADLLTTTSSVGTPVITANRSVNVNPSAVNVTSSVNSPVVTGQRHVTANASLVSVTSSLYEPVVTAEQSGVNAEINAVLLSATASVLAPTITARQNISTSVDILSTASSLGTPTVTGKRNITVNATALVLTSSIFEPDSDTTRSVTITAQAVTLTASVIAPTIETVEYTTVEPSLVGLTTSIYAPVIQTQVVARPNILSVTSSVADASITTYRSVTVRPRIVSTDDIYRLIWMDGRLGYRLTGNQYTEV